MMSNYFGKLYRLTTFGESHGKAIGGIIEGCPAGLELDLDFIQIQLDRRRPSQSIITSQRNEIDKVEFLSGIFEGKTTGTPIGFIIYNLDSRSQDYDHLKDVYRSSHADFTYQSKYGIRDHRGGGRSSARETACRVVAGSIAQKLLENQGIKIFAYVNAVSDIKMECSYKDIDLSLIDSNIVRCPDQEKAISMVSEIKKMQKEGDTVGGEISAVAIGVPAGWGEPVFDKLHADLAKSMLSINAVKSFKYGFENIDISSSRGSDVNDVVLDTEGRTSTNFSGGIQGGITNGNDIYCKISFKPVSTLMQKQNLLNKKGDKVEVEAKGRHDPCVVPRAVPIVESMMSLTLIDHYFRSKINKL